MGLYYQAVMDKSKLKEANRLHNKIEYLKDQLERISRFEIERNIQITNSYDSYFYIPDDKRKHREEIGGVRAIIFRTLARF